MHDATVRTFPSREAWLGALVDAFRAAQQQSVAARGRFAVAFSGGNTPRPFHAALAAAGLPWSHTLAFLGDERCVPAAHPESNLGMLRATLLRPAGFPAGNECGWDTALAPAQAADAMESLIDSRLGPDGRLDLCVLGIGTDGHTASLFPGTAALGESARRAVANAVPQLGTTRLTFTFPFLNAARDVWFLVSGRDKTPVLEGLRAAGCDLPAARIRNATVFHCAD